MSRIAFYTFGILREAFGHEQVQPFWDKTPAVFEAAENTEGFVDRVRVGGASPHFYDEQRFPATPPGTPGTRAPATLSLWTDLESIYAFVYRGLHGDAFRKRKEWFVRAEWPTYVAWWVDDDHMPTLEEAVERHRYIHENGATPYAFDFRASFDEAGSPTRLSRPKVEKRRQSLE